MRYFRKKIGYFQNKILSWFFSWFHWFFMWKLLQEECKLSILVIATSSYHWCIYWKKGMYCGNCNEKSGYHKSTCKARSRAKLFSFFRDLSPASVLRRKLTVWYAEAGENWPSLPIPSSVCDESSQIISSEAVCRIHSARSIAMIWFRRVW